MSDGVRYLKVLLHTPSRERRSIGYLSQFGDVFRLSFEPAYIEDARRPTLSLSYRGETEAATEAILRSLRDERLVRNDGRLPVWFQNLLPEGHNRTRLANARGCGEDDELELLAAAGHDLFGAVEVEPVDATQGVPDPVASWHAAMGLDVVSPSVVREPIEDGASLPGVVTKFSAIKEGRRYVVKRHGEAGSYILKLPSSRHPDLVENELTGYRLLGSLGLQCAKATRVAREDAELPEHIEHPHVLAVERFDRGPDKLRIHMEELSQVLGLTPRKKYGAGLRTDFPLMLRVLDRLSANPSGDVRELLLRLVAFVLMGNTDAHMKNWALLYPNGVAPVLAPLYDPVCVAAWFDELPAAEYALNRKIDAELCALTWSDLDELLQRAQIARKGRLIAQAKDVARRAQREWPALLADAPANVRRMVSARLAGGVALTSSL
jgi:serine/threonine-protein kinase HipA